MRIIRNKGIAFMRRWHRWLSVIFGVFMLWIAATGVLSQVGSLVNKGGFEAARPAPGAALPGVPADFKCPETMICRAKPAPSAWNVGLLHHLHSGEQFGPAGVIISILSGLSLLFFAFSGLWMYIQMFRARSRRERQSQSRFFWG
ncbi:MAG: PepSY domain-containing protein [Sphingomicrobium sp.]